MERIGVFGGTFDPPHLGHMIFAEAARVQFALDKVLFVPAGDPYHKGPGSAFKLVVQRDDLSSAADRLAMTRLAVTGNDAFEVDERELRRPGPSYTVDTLEEIAAEHPEARLFLLVGADSAAEIDRWKAVGRLTELARIIVAPRGDLSALTPPASVELLAVSMPRVDITSTYVRDQLRAGRSVRYLLAETVIEYIINRGLFAPG